MTNIDLDVYTCEAFELPNGGTFSPTTSTLITGDTQAVLVDTQYREPDVLEVIRRIEASGKTLTTIFITHGHFDHYFGLEMLLAHFPYARAVATPAVAAYIAGNHSAERKFAVELCGSHGARQHCLTSNPLMLTLCSSTTLCSESSTLSRLISLPRRSCTSLPLARSSQETRSTTVSIPSWRPVVRPTGRSGSPASTGSPP